MRLGFEDGAALVAGGSGGIGSAIVARLAASGIPVAFTYHDRREAAERIVGEHRGPAAVAAFQWSSADVDVAARLFARAEEQVGPIRFLVAASGISQEAAFHTLPPEEMTRLVTVNLNSVLALVRTAVTPMLKRGAGRIVLLGSVSGQRGIKGHTVYASTKAALEGFTRALAQEAGSFGVTVNCVAPGFIESTMTAGVPPTRRKGWIRRIPLGRLGTAAEVAHLVGYLLSNEASYVTGQTFTIDGGISL